MRGFLRIQTEWMARMNLRYMLHTKCSLTHSFISMSQNSVIFDVIGFLENVQIHNQLWFVGSSGPSFAAGATVQQSWVVGCQAH